MGPRGIHDGYRAIENQTSSDRVVIRLLAVTNDHLWRVAVFSDPEIESSSRPRDLSDDRAQLIDEAHEVVTPLPVRASAAPDSLSRTLLGDKALGDPADGRPSEWRRMPRVERTVNRAGR